VGTTDIPEETGDVGTTDIPEETGDVGTTDIPEETGIIITGVIGVSVILAFILIRKFNHR
jgi:hypothetical protein